MNLASAFAASANKHAGKIALYWGEEGYSYGNLWEETVFVSDRLQSQFGVKPGERVGLWLKNCPEFVPSFFGILEAGAVVVPINNFLKPAEVNFILQDAGIDVLITDRELGAHFAVLAGARPGLKLYEVEGLKGLKGLNKLNSGKRDDAESRNNLAVIVYTSGTTGRPKGAMLSHGNLLHNVESCRLVLHCVHEDRMAVLLPMFHSFMLCVGVFLPMLVGGSIVLIRSLH